MEAPMATANDRILTLLSQGKFIQTADRRGLEAEARRLRAAAFRDAGSTIWAGIRGWLVLPVRRLAT
jgi:hypothetical protein